MIFIMFQWISLLLVHSHCTTFAVPFLGIACANLCRLTCCNGFFFPHYFVTPSVTSQIDVDDQDLIYELPISHPAKDYFDLLHHIQQLYFEGQLVPIFVPSTNQLDDIFTKATFTSMWNCIGVGVMVSNEGMLRNSLSIWFLFIIKGRCEYFDVMSFLHVLLFILRGDVEYKGVIFFFGYDRLCIEQGIYKTSLILRL